MAMDKDRIEELNEQINDLKKRWPAHSVPPAMMEQLDELEEELSRELERRGGSGDLSVMEAASLVMDRLKKHGLT